MVGCSQPGCGRFARWTPAWAGAAVAVVIGLAGAMTRGADPVGRPAGRPAMAAVDFARDVRPIFDRHCVRCHGPEKQKSDYRLDRAESALRGGSIGGAVVPGD